MPETVERSPSPADSGLRRAARLDRGSAAYARWRADPPPPEPAGASRPRSSGARVNPICPRLEAQLATIDRGGGSGDPAKDEQIRRYQDAAAKQQAELDRVTTQAKRMGCDSSGFFSLFNGQSAQCGPVNNQIQQMRGNLDQITDQPRAAARRRHRRRRSRKPAPLGADRARAEQLRPAICQRRARAARQLPRQSVRQQQQPIPARLPGADLGPQSGTFRTVCVRTCDGAYFPVSFATVPARFPDDEKTCKALCPAAEATLFAYRNPGEDINQAVSISGQPYTALPNAFKFRTEFNPSCACKAAGPDLVGRAENHRRQGRRRTAGRHHRHRGEREEDAQQRAQPTAKRAAAKKGAGARRRAATPQRRSRRRHRSCGRCRPQRPTEKTGSIRTVGPTFIPPEADSELR